MKTIYNFHIDRGADMRSRLCLGVLGLCAYLLSPVYSYAQSTPADFYKGKDIHFLISHPAGGGYDMRVICSA
jgi:hypothetical protein